MSNATAAPQAQPRYWPCGTCRAEGGELCRTVTGNPAPSHVDRHRSVTLWLKYGQQQTAEQAQRAKLQAFRANVLLLPCDGRNNGGCDAWLGEVCQKSGGASKPDGHMYRKDVAKYLGKYLALPAEHRDPEIDGLLAHPSRASVIALFELTPRFRAAIAAGAK